MIDWDPLIEPKFVKQAFLQPALLSHHPPVPNRFDGLLQNTSSVSLLSEFFNGIQDICNGDLRPKVEGF